MARYNPRAVAPRTKIHYFTISQRHVDEHKAGAHGPHTRLAEATLGNIGEYDIGKRVYNTGVENTEQVIARIGAAWPEGDPRYPPAHPLSAYQINRLKRLGVSMPTGWAKALIKARAA